MFFRQAESICTHTKTFIVPRDDVTLNLLGITLHPGADHDKTAITPASHIRAYPVENEAYLRADPFFPGN